jgi:hypothetical protein
MRRWRRDEDARAAVMPPAAAREPRANKNMNGFWTAAGQSLRGSLASRNSHSSPTRWSHAGAWRFAPARKSKAAPTPSMTHGSASRWAAIQRSCFGQPRPTNRMRTPEASIACRVLAASASVSGRKGGLAANAMRSSGCAASKRSRSCASTSGLPP